MCMHIDVYTYHTQAHMHQKHMHSLTYRYTCLDTCVHTHVIHTYRHMCAHNACIPEHCAHSHGARMRSLLSLSFHQLRRSISLPFCAVEPGAGLWAVSQQTASHLVYTELWTPQGENQSLVQEPSVFLCSRFRVCWIGPFVGNRASIVTDHFLALVTTVTGIGVPIPTPSISCLAMC